MKAKNLIPFIVILVILAGLVVVRNSAKKTPTMREQTKLEDLVPSGLAAKDIAKLELFSGAKADEKVVLEREGDAWRVASSFNAPADKTTLDTFLDKVVKLKGEPRAAGDADEKLASYNLKDDQAFHVRAFKSGASDPAVDILVGKAPNYRTVFMRKAGDKRIYVESANLRQDAGIYGDDLDKAPTGEKWLDKNILKLEKDKINKIALTLPDKSLVFERIAKERPPQETPAEAPSEDQKDEGEKTEGETAKPETPPKVEYEWVLTSGGLDKTFKQPGLDAIIQKMTALTAVDVADPAKKAEWGLDPPQFKAVISLDGQDDVVIEGGHTSLAGNGHIRIASSDKDLVYAVSKYNFEQLFSKGSTLFDLPKLAINKEDVSRIEIAQPEGRVVIAKDGADWKVIEPAYDLEAQKPTLSSLVSAVSSWTPSEYADAGAPIGDLNRSVTVVTGAASRTISLGDEAKSIEGSYARLDGVETLLIMSAADVKRIFLKPRDVYQMKVFNIVEDDVAAVEIKQGDTAFSLARKDDEAWTLSIDGNTHEADGEKCNEFLSTLSEFQATGIHPGMASSQVVPQITITAHMKNGTANALAFSAEENGLHLATVSGKSVVLEADKAGIDGFLRQIEALKQPKPAPAPVEAPAPSGESSESAEVTLDASGGDQDAAPEETETPVEIAIPAENSTSAETPAPAAQ